MHTLHVTRRNTVSFCKFLFNVQNIRISLNSKVFKYLTSSIILFCVETGTCIFMALTEYMAI
jgi:hypothetical protein